MPKPRPGKVPKKCFRKCRSETGCRGKCRKKCSGLPSPILPLHRRGARSTFFGTFLGTPFRTGTFRSTFFGTFPGRGFGTSLDGRQDRKPSWLYPNRIVGNCRSSMQINARASQVLAGSESLLNVRQSSTTLISSSLMISAILSQF